MPLALPLGLLLASMGAGAGCAETWKGSVGAVLARDNRTHRVYVREAPSDLGAARAGVLVDDEVVAVDGKPARDLSNAELHEALAGKVGTKVTLQIVREGVTHVVVVERSPLKGPTAPEL